MNTILIDTTSKNIEFAFSNPDKITIFKKLDSESNADSLIYKVKEEFALNNINFKDIDVVSLSNGPGSFTGLRIGSAISKGICLALNSKLVEIPTLDVIVNKLLNPAEGIIYTSLVFSNSRTMEFYCCDYSFENGEFIISSDYYIQTFKNIEYKDRIFLINEKIDFEIPAGFNVQDLSSEPNLPAQLFLTNKYIKAEKFSDYRFSEPLYMKKFVPLK